MSLQPLNPVIVRDDEIYRCSSETENPLVDREQELTRQDASPIDEIVPRSRIVSAREPGDDQSPIW
jgi:hypothetical protein